MPLIDNVENSTTFSQWASITNEIILLLSDFDNLNTTDKTNIVNALNEVLNNLGDITGLLTTDKTSLTNALNELVQDIGDTSVLTGTVSSNIVTMLSAISTANSNIATNLSNITDNTTDIGNNTTSITNIIDGSTILSSTPKNNLLKNNGRLANESITTKVVTTFNSSDSMLNTYNNSILTQDDKFIDDNTDNGGSAGNMGANIISLLAAQGESSRLNGYEFYLLNVVGGSGVNDGVTVSATDYYPFTTSLDKFIGAIGSKITYTCWLKVQSTSVNIIVGNANIDTYISGVTHDFNTPITSGDGWVHVRQTTTLTNNFDTFIPAFYGNVGDEILIGLPALFNSSVNIVDHKGLL